MFLWPLQALAETLTNGKATGKVKKSKGSKGRNKGKSSANSGIDGGGIGSGSVSVHSVRSTTSYLGPHRGGGSVGTFDSGGLPQDELEEARAPARLGVREKLRRLATQLPETWADYEWPWQRKQSNS